MVKAKEEAKATVQQLEEVPAYMNIRAQGAQLQNWKAAATALVNIWKKRHQVAQDELVQQVCFSTPPPLPVRGFSLPIHEPTCLKAGVYTGVFSCE